MLLVSVLLDRVLHRRNPFLRPPRHSDKELEGLGSLSFCEIPRDSRNKQTCSLLDWSHGDCIKESFRATHCAPSNRWMQQTSIRDLAVVALLLGSHWPLAQLPNDGIAKSAYDLWDLWTATLPLTRSPIYTVDAQ